MLRKSRASDIEIKILEVVFDVSNQYCSRVLVALVFFVIQTIFLNFIVLYNVSFKNTLKEYFKMRGKNTNAKKQPCVSHKMCRKIMLFYANYKAHRKQQ